MEINLRSIGNRFKIFYFLFSSLVNHQEASFSKWSEGAVKNFHLWNIRENGGFLFFFSIVFHQNLQGESLFIYHMLNGCTKIENIWDRGFSHGKKNGGGGYAFSRIFQEVKINFLPISTVLFASKTKKKQFPSLNVLVGSTVYITLFFFKLRRSVSKMTFVVFPTQLQIQKYYCCFFFSLSIQETKSLFSKTSFVLRCKSRKLFFSYAHQGIWLLFFFLPTLFFVLCQLLVSRPTPEKKKKLVEIFVFVPNLYCLEFETETKRTDKLW